MTAFRNVVASVADDRRKADEARSGPTPRNTDVCEPEAELLAAIIGQEVPAV